MQISIHSQCPKQVVLRGEEVALKNERKNTWTYVFTHTHNKYVLFFFCKDCVVMMLVVPSLEISPVQIKRSEVQDFSSFLQTQGEANIVILKYAVKLELQFITIN